MKWGGEGAAGGSVTIQRSMAGNISRTLTQTIPHWSYQMAHQWKVLPMRNSTSGGNDTLVEHGREYFENVDTRDVTRGFYPRMPQPGHSGRRFAVENPIMSK